MLQHTVQENLLFRLCSSSAEPRSIGQNNYILEELHYFFAHRCMCRTFLLFLITHYDYQHQPQTTCRHQQPVHHSRCYPASSPARNLYHPRTLHLDIVEANWEGTSLPNPTSDPYTPALQHWQRRLSVAVQKYVSVTISVR